ncbi:hypothetical protein MNBD_BACTEROID06-117 [hydrothermal vent metagenome]|uniref:STAS domain-containing protein n=1 Tax=hydrothermal vent metagenome TaxID=652676 RepID=A0A3B0V947_9ZZZZ
MVKIETKIEDKVASITIEGDIDASSSIQLDESLSSQVNTSQTLITIDCSELHYISSAGLGVFMSYIEEFKDSGQKFVLFALSEKVKNVFNMLGLDQLMNIVSTKEEALNFLNEE